MKKLSYVMIQLQRAPKSLPWSLSSLSPPPWEIFVRSLILLRGGVFKLFVQTFPSVFYCCVTTGKHRGTKLHFILKCSSEILDQESEWDYPCSTWCMRDTEPPRRSLPVLEDGSNGQAWPEHLTGDVRWCLRSPCGPLSWLSDMWSLQ